MNVFRSPVLVLRQLEMCFDACACVEPALPFCCIWYDFNQLPWRFETCLAVCKCLFVCSTFICYPMFVIVKTCFLSTWRQCIDPSYVPWSQILREQGFGMGILCIYLSPKSSMTEVHLWATFHLRQWYSASITSLVRRVSWLLVLFL